MTLTPEKIIELGARDCAGVGTFEARRLFEAYTRENKNTPVKGIAYIPLASGTRAKDGGAVKVWREPFLGKDTYGITVLRRDGDHCWLDYEASSSPCTRPEEVIVRLHQLMEYPVDDYDHARAVCVKAYELPDEMALSRYVFAEEWVDGLEGEALLDWYFEHEVEEEHFSRILSGGGYDYPLPGGGSIDSSITESLSWELKHIIANHYFPVVYGTTMDEMGIEMEQAGSKEGWLKFHGFAHSKQWDFEAYLKWWLLQQLIHEWVAEHSSAEYVVHAGKRPENYIVRGERGGNMEEILIARPYAG